MSAHTLYTPPVMWWGEHARGMKPVMNNASPTYCLCIWQYGLCWAITNGTSCYSRQLGHAHMTGGVWGACSHMTGVAKKVRAVVTSVPTQSGYLAVGSHTIHLIRASSLHSKPEVNSLHHYIMVISFLLQWLQHIHYKSHVQQTFSCQQQQKI